MLRTFTPSAALRLGRAIVIAIAAFSGIWASIGSAGAEQGRCATRTDLSQALEKRYSEVPVAVGLIDGKTIVEIFARADGETWTIVTSNANGTSCVLGAGKAWQLLPLKSVGPAS